ncbi:MAG TPA: hypothetical protein VHO01_16985 [Jatrophihabitans sp.]|nr:hypothetical protein [Jatrophihabitans sp.]
MLLVLTVTLRATFPTIRPTNGTDASWELALNTYRQYHLRFGPQLLYTYGPWGCIDYPLETDRRLLLVAAVVALVAAAAAWWVCYRLLRRLAAPWLAAVLCTVLVLVGMQSAEKSALLLVAAVAAGFSYLAWRAPGRLPWLPGALAGAGALLTQAKFSEGLILSAIAALCAIGAPERRLRRLAEVVLGWLVVSALAWLAAGQRLTDYPRWFGGALQVAAGYTEAMGVEVGPTWRSYLIMAALAGLLVAFSIGQYRRAPRGSGVRGSVLAVSALGLLAAYLGFKEATVQHGVEHDVYFYLLVLPLFLGYLALDSGRRLRAVALAAVVLLGTSPWTLSLAPGTVLHRQLRTVRALTDGRYRADQLAAARAQMQPRYALSAPLQDALAGRPLAVDTVESSIAWAFDVPWRPVPIFQTFVAYTAALDRRNASAIANAPADQQILRSVVGSIPGRNALWDSPRYVLAEVCNYRVRLADPRWLLLDKAANRCGGASALAAPIRVRAGQPVPVPVAASGQIVLMSFQPVAPGPLVRLGRLLDKSFSPLRVTVNGKAYRLPRALADGPLIASLPASVGWSGRFLLGSPYHEVSFSEDGTLTFSAVSLDGQAGAAAHPG